VAAYEEDPGVSFERGVRAGIPFAAAGLLLGVSFGVLAREAGMPPLAIIGMSMIMFASSAQFAAIAILAAGGGIGAAIGAAALMNMRLLPVGMAVAPSLPGGLLKRVAQGQAVLVTSWTLASRGDGTLDRWMMFGATAPQYATWSVGTIIGALAGGALPDASALGLDAIFPAFFLALLVPELRDRRSRAVAAVAGLIAVGLAPVVPPGVPILIASLAAPAGAWSRRR
jgi:predicted branched-subunit amino acid permease